MEGQELSILDELEQRFQRLEKCMKWFLDLKVNERLYALECKGKESDALATLLHEDAGLEFHDADVFSEITTARTCTTLGTKSIGVDMPKLPDSDESERMRFSFQKQTTSSLGMRFQEPEDLTPQEYYKFAASTWDLVLFAGHERVGRVGSIQSIVLVCATILMQGVFAGIAWFNFLISEIDESTVADALQWRLSVAHSSTQYDAVVGKSLVERVCAEDKSLHVSGIQMTLYDDMKKYLQLDEVGVASFFNGQTLCIVALLCWYMMVAKEVSQALALHRAILALPTSPGEPTKIQARENPFTQMIVYRLKSTTWKRKVVSYMLLVYRLLAAGFLIYVGSFFLAYTVNVTELLLNAVSLDIILDIDNYIFMACASTAGKDLLDRLEPLQVPSYPRFKGTDVKSVLVSLLVPCLTIVVYIGILQPMTDTLTQVSQLLCGGEHNFIWAVDHRHFTLLSRTNSSQNMNFAQLDAVKEAGAFLPEQYAGFGLWIDQPSHLTSLLSRSAEDQIAELNPDCGDVADRDEIMLNYLRDSLDDWSVQSCADVVSYCTSLTGLPDWTIDGGRGFVTRMLCSETCGCSDPGGEFIFAQGCPYSSQGCVLSDRYLTKLHDPQQGDCTQRSAAELRNFTPWRSWTQQLRAYANHPSNDLPGRKEVGFLAEAMWEVGCDFETALRLKNVTFGTHYVYNPPFHWGFKTLAYFCPQSAGCHSLPLTAQDNRCPMPFGCQCNGICSALDGGFHLSGSSGGPPGGGPPPDGGSPDGGLPPQDTRPRGEGRPQGGQSGGGASGGGPPDGGAPGGGPPNGGPPDGPPDGGPPDGGPPGGGPPPDGGSPDGGLPPPDGGPPDGGPPSGEAGAALPTTSTTTAAVTMVQTSGAMDINVDGGDAATVEIAVENTLADYFGVPEPHDEYIETEAFLDSTRRLASQVAERRLEDVKWSVSWDVFMPEEQMDEVTAAVEDLQNNSASIERSSAMLQGELQKAGIGGFKGLSYKNWVPPRKEQILQDHNQAQDHQMVDHQAEDHQTEDHQKADNQVEDHQTGGPPDGEPPDGGPLDADGGVEGGPPPGAPPEGGPPDGGPSGGGPPDGGPSGGGPPDGGPPQGGPSGGGPPGGGPPDGGPPDGGPSGGGPPGGVPPDGGPSGGGPPGGGPPDGGPSSGGPPDVGGPTEAGADGGPPGGGPSGGGPPDGGPPHADGGAEGGPPAGGPPDGGPPDGASGGGPPDGGPPDGGPPGGGAEGGPPAGGPPEGQSGGGPPAGGPLDGGPSAGGPPGGGAEGGPPAGGPPAGGPPDGGPPDGASGGGPPHGGPPNGGPDGGPPSGSG